MSHYKRLQQLLSSRIFQHTLFWAFFIFTEISRYVEMDYQFGLGIYILKMIIRLGGAAIVVYINLRILIPRLLNNKKNGLYIISTLVLMVGMASLVSQIMISFKGNDITLSELELHHRALMPQKLVMIIFMQNFLMTIISSLIHFTKEWIKLKDVAIELKEVEKQKLEAELKALKAQINPHFLFNTLNNIYALSLDKSDKTPRIILKLSDLLSYIIYDCQEERVALKDEIDFIKNYIELERIRVSDDFPIEFTYDDDIEDISIAPLLFISFIENAFKHSAKSMEDQPYIRYSIRKEQDEIVFRSENKKAEIVIEEQKKYKGVGIENVKKRLQLIYPERHRLKITNENSIFKVELRIKL